MKEIVKRTARTFIQAALGFFAANCVGWLSGTENSPLSGENALLALTAAAVASGLCAVMNVPTLKRKNEVQCECNCGCEGCSAVCSCTAGELDNAVDGARDTEGEFGIVAEGGLDNADETNGGAFGNGKERDDG